jgi:large subunit ribosomal protein L24
MHKFHVKKGDEVVVITGNERGRRGRVLQVLRKRHAVILEATDDKGRGETERDRLIAPRLHYKRKSQQHPNGAMIWLPGAIHISNVMKAEKYDARRARRAAAVGGS